MSISIAGVAASPNLLDTLPSDVLELARERARATRDFRASSTILESWSRSFRNGLPLASKPEPVENRIGNAEVVSAVSNVLWKRKQHIDSAEVSLLLTDDVGVILQEWSGSRTLSARLDRLNITVGFRAGEDVIGTSSATSLVTGKPMYVRGLEHFAEGFEQMACAGAVIRDPASGETVGSLSLVTRLSQSSPLALAWVCELADEASRVLEGRSRATSAKNHGAPFRRTLEGLERVEAETLVDALRRAGGNRKRAAESLGIARSTLYRKIRALGIEESLGKAGAEQRITPCSAPALPFDAC